MRHLKFIKPLTPFLYIIFPILFLYVQNVDEMNPGDIIEPLVICIILTLPMLGIIFLFCRDIIKTALITTIWIVLFFSYGHISIIWNSGMGGVENVLSGIDKIVLPGLALLGIIVSVLIYRSSKAAKSILGILFGVGIILVSIQLLLIGNSVIQSKSNQGVVDIAGIQLKSDITNRDIYLIILDGYGRQDILADIYGFDNSQFIDFLKRKDFHIADSAQSNYPQTLQTLTSVLNFNYLDSLLDVEITSKDREPMHNQFINNRVMASLKQLGYSTVAFETGYAMSEYKQAESYIKADWKSGEFINILLSTTPLPKIFGDVFSPYELHRARILNTLDKLDTIENPDQSELIIAHIIAPHPPFVFNADGTPIDIDRPFNMGDGSHYIDAGGDSADYKSGYINQVKFINGKITGIIESLLDRPVDHQPIIILMGDHGPGSELSWTGSSMTNLKERFSILYGLYLPNGDYDSLSDSLTPVNTFRLIFNTYFGTELPLLDNASFYTTWNEPYDFIQIDKITGDGIHDYLLGVYNERSPNFIEYRHVSHPKTQSNPANSSSCFILNNDGLTIKLHKTLHSKFMEYSIDHNDSYMIYFRLDSTILAAGEIDRREIPGGGLRVDRTRVPDLAVQKGFNNIFIVPVEGDNQYALGHIRFAGDTKK